MLKNIPKVISPQLLKVLSEMGHTDELVIADANFPGHTYGKQVIRCDGIDIPTLLKAILTLFPLDSYAKENFILMQVVAGDNYKPTIWEEYKKIARQYEGDNFKLADMDKWDFYERAKNASAVIVTGEESLYANIILKKGVIV